MQQAKDTILKVIALIENPKAWTQNVAARDSTGLPVMATDTEACRWCTLGALDKVTADYKSGRAATRRVREVLQKEHPSISIAKFNDNHTHAEVLALLRKAAYAR
jgi:hypothetical protein